MAKGDLRKCSFCLKDYIVSATNKLSECCAICRARHRSSKNGKIKIDKWNEQEKKFRSGSPDKGEKGAIARKIDAQFNCKPVLDWGKK